MTSSKPPSLRELNRTLLLRQLLLERKRMSVVRAVHHLVALQAQYAPSPYVALWSRLVDFRKEQLHDERIVKAGTLRTTLHVQTRELYPALASAYIESQRARENRLGVDIGALRKAVGRKQLTSAELFELGYRVLGTDDRWTVAFAYRALPFVRTAPLGPWPHTKPSPVALWRETLPDPAESAVRIVHAYLAAYGPATRDDIQHFTGFKIRQIAPALEGLTEEGGYYDLPGAPRATGKERAPVRFLPAFDSIILAHKDTSRIIPPEHYTRVHNKKNATSKNTFTVDGFTMGTWRVEKKQLLLDPFEALSPKWRREVDAEGERLLAWYLS